MIDCPLLGILSHVKAFDCKSHAGPHCYWILLVLLLLGRWEQIERFIETASRVEGGVAHKGRLSRMEITQQPTPSLKSIGSCPLGIAPVYPPRGCFEGRGWFSFLFLTLINARRGENASGSGLVESFNSPSLFLQGLFFLPTAELYIQ